MSGHGTWSGQGERPQRSNSSGGGSYSDISKRLKESGISFNVSDFEGSGYDQTTVVDGISGVERMLEEFPALKGKILGVVVDTDADAPAYMTADVNNRFVTLHMGDTFRKNMEDFGHEMNGAKFHPYNTTAASTMAHEMGHVIEKHLADMNHQTSWDSFNAMKSGEQAERILNVAAGKFSGQTLKALRQSVSGYSMASMSESLAECVSDVYANGSSASPFAQEVWRVLKRELS